MGDGFFQCLVLGVANSCFVVSDSVGAILIQNRTEALDTICLVHSCIECTAGNNRQIDVLALSILNVSTDFTVEGTALDRSIKFCCASLGVVQEQGCAGTIEGAVIDGNVSITGIFSLVEGGVHRVVTIEGTAVNHSGGLLRGGEHVQLQTCVAGRCTSVKGNRVIVVTKLCLTDRCAIGTQGTAVYCQGIVVINCVGCATLCGSILNCTAINSQSAVIDDSTGRITGAGCAAYIGQLAAAYSILNGQSTIVGNQRGCLGYCLTQRNGLAVQIQCNSSTLGNSYTCSQLDVAIQLYRAALSKCRFQFFGGVEFSFDQLAVLVKLDILGEQCFIGAADRLLGEGTAGDSACQRFCIGCTDLGSKAAVGNSQINGICIVGQIDGGTVITLGAGFERTAIDSQRAILHRLHPNLTVEDAAVDGHRTVPQTDRTGIGNAEGTTIDGSIAAIVENSIVNIAGAVRRQVLNGAILNHQLAATISDGVNAPGASVVHAGIVHADFAVAGNGQITIVADHGIACGAFLGLADGVTAQIQNDFACDGQSIRQFDVAVQLYRAAFCDCFDQFGLGIDLSFDQLAVLVKLDILGEQCFVGAADRLLGEGTAGDNACQRFCIGCTDLGSKAAVGNSQINGICIVGQIDGGTVITLGAGFERTAIDSQRAILHRLHPNLTVEDAAVDGHRTVPQTDRTGIGNAEGTTIDGSIAAIVENSIVNIAGAVRRQVLNGAILNHQLAATISDGVNAPGASVVHAGIVHADFAVAGNGQITIVADHGIACGAFLGLADGVTAQIQNDFACDGQSIRQFDVAVQLYRAAFCDRFDQFGLRVNKVVDNFICLLVGNQTGLFFDNR